jgi:hypothetical protein
MLHTPWSSLATQRGAPVSPKDHHYAAADNGQLLWTTLSCF